MTTFLLILFGFLAGIVGGMGMGGGTVLVPLLSFLDIPQKTIQAINLVSFLPMCCVALVFHAKNKLVQTKHVLWLIAPAVVFAVVGALVADAADNKVLRLCFACFLIAVGVWQLFVAIKFIVNKKRGQVADSNPADTGVLVQDEPTDSEQ
ncbi:MAG: sulfite exporter TauE/SafE family protein [Clostridiales bacterium]|nr:sulfite exporter TauE/SafE family protein [Clostridiales bacterium]